MRPGRPSLAVGGAYWVAATKVAQVPKVAIDPALLATGRQLPADRLRLARVRRQLEATPPDFGSASTQTGQRSDTIMLAHVGSGKGDSFLVSFPRDLWVNIPEIGHAKINAAFNAGPQRVIETIEQNFDVPVSHYLQVDFAGFRKIVDAIGTVPIYFPAPARDDEDRSRRQARPAASTSSGDAGARVRAVAVLRVVRRREVADRRHVGSRAHQAAAVLPADARARGAAHA